MATNSIPIPRSHAASPPAAAVSVSPNAGSFSSPFHGRRDSLHANAVRQPKVLHPVAQEEIKLLLLENISQDAVRAFKSQGFQVDHFTKAWSEDELVAKIGQYHAIGIRSKTKITEPVLKAATKVSAMRGTRCPMYAAQQTLTQS